ncbi:MAG: ACT domain-containing protein [Clostridia bacterium]|nr:ACT domain-containing protein [Clostridia bacterium]
MKAVISVVGHDKVGIIAKVSALLAEHNVNILDISQTVMQGYFTMIMLVDVEKLDIKFGDFADLMSGFGDTIDMNIRVQHEDIFNSMHRI